jgi:hypothetical protein
VGETGRPLQVRVNEHKRNWEKMKREGGGQGPGQCLIIISCTCSGAEPQSTVGWSENFGKRNKCQKEKNT